MDDAVDVVIAGHTHSQLNLSVDGKLVVESFAYGTGYDRVRIDVRSRDRRRRQQVGGARRDDAHRHGAGPRAGEPCGGVRAPRGAARRARGRRARRAARLGRLSELAADAQRAFAGADVAFVNGGNTRAPTWTPAITYADAFEVQCLRAPGMAHDGCAARRARRGAGAQPRGPLWSPARRLRPDGPTRWPPTRLVAGGARAFGRR